MMIAPFETDYHVEPPPRPRTIPAPALERGKPRHK
jgi:hypothetical protein